VGAKRATMLMVDPPRLAESPTLTHLLTAV
jgi:hypothetical protein